MRLPHLSDEQVAEVSRLSRGIDLDTCPTCLSQPDEFGERTNGTYKFKGQERKCDCQQQIMLRKHYLLANIPDQYMRLDWERDFQGPADVSGAVNQFLERWDIFKLNGMGLEFASQGLGTGKTFAATSIAKELVKRKEKVFFLPFTEVIQNPDESVWNRMRDVTVLILDEVIPPWTERSTPVFAGRFESIVRHRTNFNGVTIMTTNISEDDWERYYPRTYSLLCAKQIRIDIDGKDARMSQIAEENLKLLMNEEVRPIT